MGKGTYVEPLSSEHKLKHYVTELIFAQSRNYINLENYYQKKVDRLTSDLEDHPKWIPITITCNCKECKEFSG